jgi:hypothetical protein
MSAPTRAVLTAVAAAVVALAAWVGEPALVVVAGLLALTVAVGWRHLLNSPARRGATGVIALGGLAGVVAVLLTEGEPFLRNLPEVLALSVLLAFVHELVRRDGRERLVESVAGVVSGTLVATCATGWVAVGRTDAGTAVVVTGAVALAVASAVSAAPPAGWLGAAITAAAGVAAGAGAAALLPDVEALPGAVVGLAVGVLVATLHRLFDGLPSARGRWPCTAAAVLPVTVTGIVVYVVGRVLGG